MTIAIIAFIVLMLMRVPIAFVLGMTTVIYILTSGNMELMATIPQRLYSGMESYGLLAIPLFMLAGELMNSGGLTKRLVSFAQTLVGHFKGGLAYVNVLTNMMLASIVGSASAQIAMMSRTMVPAMEKEGYSRSFSAATTASAGILGPIIPPSMQFIIYGVASGVSIGSLFLAGVVPGILLVLAFMVLIAIIGMKQSWPTHNRAKAVEMFKHFVQVIPALFVPVVIVMGIISGIFTPTESAAIACIVAIIVGFFFYKELKIKDLPNVFVNAALTTAIITLLIAMANIFGWMLTFEQIPQTIASWMTSLTENPLVFLLLVNIFLLLIGMFMDGIAALVILTPIFVPIIANYGIDPIHFGVIICINLTIALLTPPVGAGLYITSSAAKISIGNITKAILPFLVIAYVVLAIITYFPDLVLWLPSLLE